MKRKVNVERFVMRLVKVLKWLRLLIFKGDLTTLKCIQSDDPGGD